MIVFYFLCLIPMIIGSILWYHSKQIVWWEWLIGTFVSFLLAFGYSKAINYGMLTDYETWSGYANQLIYYPEWVEEEEDTYEDSDGDTHTTTNYITHWEYWTLKCSVGGEREISENTFNSIKPLFSDRIITKYVYKPDFYSGDPNIYLVNNEKDYKLPTTAWKRFENRVKCSPNLFNFSEVPEGIKVYEYPQNSNFLSSNRLLGTAQNTLNILEFDRFNSNLGPRKKVNVILIGFGKNSDISLAHYQEAKWYGGKKNDLVICYGGNDPLHPLWSYCFGWTEQFKVLRNLETIVLNNSMDDSILPLLMEEIWKNYLIKDWSKFDYIEVDPPFWSYPVFLIIIGLIQVGLYFHFHKNNYLKIKE